MGADIERATKEAERAVEVADTTGDVQVIAASRFSSAFAGSPAVEAILGQLAPAEHRLPDAADHVRRAADAAHRVGASAA